MLQTEDIDDDYFTPASSTSLANIFGNSQNDDAIENESLKYTPSKPAHLTPKPEENKATKCVFACALLGYEWYNGAYVNRGKLAFAILNVIKTGVHNIILYDSKKVILSSATISTSFEVTVKESTYFSYLDNLQKYWSLYASEEELKKVIGHLKSFNVIIKYSTEGEKSLADITTPDSTSVTNEHMDNTEKESDTDSALYRKTKMSLLNRMANMGQSVLPPRALSAAKSSDSSDTNDSSHYKTVRHKPIKSIVKRNSTEKTVDCQALVEAQKIVIPSKETTPESMPIFTYVNGQLVPVTNSSIITSSNSNSGSDISFFISEQRVNNSELRININRISDKVDQVLDKVTCRNSGDGNTSSSSFQVEILQKLLSEYENKIRLYEEIIKGSSSSSTGKTLNITHLLGNSVQKQSDQIKESIVLNEKINNLEQLCKEKDDKINSLETEITLFKANNEQSINEKAKINENLLKEIQRLSQEMEVKNKEYTTKINMYENQCTKVEDENNIGNKIKDIMNDTFRAISANFENTESYSGERIKSVTAAVIKKVTIETLTCT